MSKHVLQAHVWFGIAQRIRSCFCPHALFLAPSLCVHAYAHRTSFCPWLDAEGCHLLCQVAHQTRVAGPTPDSACWGANLCKAFTRQRRGGHPKRGVASTSVAYVHMRTKTRNLYEKHCLIDTATGSMHRRVNGACACGAQGQRVMGKRPQKKNAVASPTVEDDNVALVVENSLRAARMITDGITASVLNLSLKYPWLCRESRAWLVSPLNNLSW